MSFSVSCGDCGLEWSGRRPFAERRRVADRRFLSLLSEVVRWLRNGREGARGREPRGADSRCLRRRARVLAAVSARHFLMPLAVGALVERRRSALSTFRPRTGSASSSGTACSAFGGTAGRPSKAARTRYVDGAAGTPSRPGASWSGSASGPAGRLRGRDRDRGRRDAAASTRSCSPRMRISHSGSWPIRALTSDGCSARGGTRGTRPSSTPTSASFHTCRPHGRPGTTTSTDRASRPSRTT